MMIGELLRRSLNWRTRQKERLLFDFQRPVCTLFFSIAMALGAGLTYAGLDKVLSETMLTKSMHAHESDLK